MGIYKSPNFTIILYTSKESVTIYFNKDGGLSRAKAFATRIANHFKHKVINIIIKYHVGDTEYPVAQKHWDHWDSHPTYDEYMKKFRLRD